MNYTYAAYIVTWAIHIIYLGILVGGIRKLHREADDLQRGK
jgi:hypothetical protein